MSRRRALLGAAAAVVVVLPLALALTDAHLAGAPAALVASTAAGALAVSALALQPLLAARRGGTLRAHRVLGAVALALVLAHVGALFLVAVDDALFALSPDGPTRARMALIATLALLGAVALGLARRRLARALAPSTWRALHAYLAVLAIALGLGHAVLTDGALDGAGTPVLLALGALGLAGVGAAAWARGASADSPRARRRSAPRR